jgi:hypothetical protein
MRALMEARAQLTIAEMAVSLAIEYPNSAEQG